MTTRFLVLFTPTAGRQQRKAEVQAHDRVHAGLLAWRAAGCRRFPRMTQDDAGHWHFDGVLMHTVELAAA